MLVSESAIGVSQVEIPEKAAGSPGAGLTPVALDTSWTGGWAAAKPSKNGFWAGGESQKEKDALMNKKADGPFARMLAGTAGGAPALTTPTS
jgi:hypothetical protein